MPVHRALHIPLRWCQHCRGENILILLVPTDICPCCRSRCVPFVCLLPQRFKFCADGGHCRWANFDTHQTKALFGDDKRTYLNRRSMTFVMIIPQGEADAVGALGLAVAGLGRGISQHWSLFQAATRNCTWDRLIMQNNSLILLLLIA